MEIKMTVCDVCQDPGRPATTYRVTCDGESASTDRCEEHGALFAQLFEKKVEKVIRSPVPRGRDGRLRVTTLEQIEEKKRNRRR